MVFKHIASYLISQYFLTLVERSAFVEQTTLETATWTVELQEYITTWSVGQNQVSLATSVEQGKNIDTVREVSGSPVSLSWIRI